MCLNYYLFLGASLTTNGLSDLTKNHNIAAITAGTINNCNVIDQPN